MHQKKKEVFERIHRVCITRLINLINIDPKGKVNFEINSTKVKLKLRKRSSDKIKSIDKKYAFRTTHYNNKVMRIIDLKTNEIVGKIGDVKDLNVKSQYFCWVNHVNKIFCCQKECDYSRESKCCLFD